MAIDYAIFNLSQSRLFNISFSLMCVLAVFIILWCCFLSSSSIPLVFVPILAFDYFTIRRKEIVRKHPNSLISLRYTINNVWELTFKNGHNGLFRFTDECYRAPWFLILNCRSLNSHNKFTIFIPYDALDREGYRRINTQLFEQ